jgi:hypothetical protein
VYGFIEPTTPITQYEVTFKKKNTHPISASMLREQVADLGLLRFDEVIAQERCIMPVGCVGT